MIDTVFGSPLALARSQFKILRAQLVITSLFKVSVTVASTVASGELDVRIDWTRSSRARASAVLTAQARLAIEFGELLLIDRPTAGIDNIIFVLELDDSALRARGLLPQLAEPILQPSSGASRRLILCLQLVVDVGICHRIGDLGGAIGITRQESRSA